MNPKRDFARAELGEGECVGMFFVETSSSLQDRADTSKATAVHEPPFACDSGTPTGSGRVR